jgi:hypothetical protein
VRAPPDPKRSPSVLLGLEDSVAKRPARDVLREVSWEGARLDPSATSAREFLAAM